MIDASRDPDRRMVSRYHVRIEFREPTYELRAGPQQEPYLFGYDVEAASKSDAEQSALREFRETARLSSVAWIRQVFQVIVTLAPHPEPGGEDPEDPRSRARQSGDLDRRRPSTTRTGV